MKDVSDVGEGTRRASILRAGFQVAAALERRPMTVAELADTEGLTLRQAYRALHALEAAGVPVVGRPEPKRKVNGGRVPVVYRVKRQAVRRAP